MNLKGAIELLFFMPKYKIDAKYMILVIYFAQIGTKAFVLAYKLYQVNYFVPINNIYFVWCEGIYLLLDVSLY